MRRFPVAAALSAAVLSAAAQQVAPPPTLEPLPEPPPPAISIDAETAAEAGIVLEPGDRAERLFIDGQEAIRVIKPNGLEYYLIGALPGEGPFPGAQPHDTRVRVPQWRVFEW